VGLVVFYGKATDTNQGSNYEKKVCLAKLENMGAPQPQLTLEPIIQRKASLNGTWGNPLSVALDPLTGNAIICDVSAGKLFSVYFI